MTCGTRYAQAEDYAAMFCLNKPLNAAERASVEEVLDLAAGDIDAARMTVDGCGCTLSAGAANFLKRLNIVLAAVFYHCTCAPVNMSESQRKAYLDWAQERLDAISNGTLELCQGHTGAAFPSAGWAEHAGTEFSRAETILKARGRYSHGLRR